MSRRFFDHDTMTGITQYFHASDDGDSFTIEEVQQVAGIIEQNKIQYNMFTSGRDSWGDGATLNEKSQVARIPNSIVNQLIQQGIWQDEKARRRWINDPDNRCWRTRPGVV
jgi:hypothetical protein